MEIGGLPLSILKSYFAELHVTSLVLLMCQDVEKTRLVPELSADGFLVSFSPGSIQDSPDFRGGAALDLSCPFAGRLIREFSRRRSFGVHTEWLFIDRVNSTQQLQLSEGYKKLEAAYLLPSSAATLLQSDGSSQASYFDLFRVSTLRPLQATLLGSGSLASFTPLSQRSTVARTDFQGIILTAGAVLYHMERFSGFDSYEHPEVDTIPKVNYPIVQTLSEQLNFSFTLIILDDYGWQTNMTFSGLMGMLQREEIDMGATGIFMRPDRILTIDFTGDTFEIKNKLIFKQPALSSVSNIFLLPFTGMVWLCCLALTSLTILLLIGDNWVSLARREAFEGSVTSSDIITTIIGCVCQQGAAIIPKSGSAKTILFLFSLCTLFFYTSYSANIVALLQSTSPTIRSLSDLAASPLSIGVQDVIYNQIYFREAVDGDVKELYKKKVQPQGKRAYMSPEEGIKRVRSGLFAFTVETHWGYKIISDTFLESEKCGIDEIRLFLLPKLSIPVIKRSGYREVFTVKNTLQRDVGLHSRVKERWLLNRPECEARGRGYVSVGLSDFKPALQVIGYGTLASLLVLAGELLHNRRRNFLLRLKGTKTTRNSAWPQMKHSFKPNIY